MRLDEATPALVLSADRESSTALDAMMVDRTTIAAPYPSTHTTDAGTRSAMVLRLSVRLVQQRIAGRVTI